MMKSIFTILFVIFFTFLAFSQPGSVLKTLPSPTTQLADLTWDGDYLYLLGLSDYNIYQIDTTNGNVLNTISTGMAGALGLTFKDGYFWLSVVSDHSLKKIDTNGSVIKSVPIPATQNIGIEWDGNAFRVADSGSPDEKILVVDSLGNLLSSFLFPGDSPFGLTWDGSTVWCADNQSSGGVATIYQFNPGDGSVITSFLCPNSGSAANGLTWDSEYLWIADQTNDLIYKVEGNPINHGPQIMVHPDTLDFDSTLTGYSVIRELTIENFGTDTLNIFDIISNDSAFSVDTTYFQILPSDSFLLPVTFSPFIPNFYSGQLQILSDDAIQDTVSVFMQGWGIAVIPPFPTEIIQTISEGDSLFVDIQLTNITPIYLDWSASIEYFQKTGSYLDSLGDTLFTADITALSQTGDETIRGIAFDGVNFWAAGANMGTPKLYQFDSNWNLLNTYDQQTVDPLGYRELVSDGAYLYGVETHRLVEIDPTNGVPTGFSIAMPVSGIWAAAYDPAHDYFWVSDTQSLYMIDRMGNMINQIPLMGLFIYGLAWDSWSPGGPFLWLWVADGPPNGPNCTAMQLNVSSGVFTGVSFTGFEMNGDPGANDQPSGATVGMINGYATFVGLQASNLQPGDGHDFAVGYSLGLTPQNWLTISPTSGTIPPWSYGIIQAKIYGIIGAQGDTLRQAEIVFTTNDPTNPVFYIPVNVTVIPLVVGLYGEANIHPRIFQLHQNYPNPFNPTTTISYQLEANSEVELVIYNLLGQQIKKLVNANQPAGIYQVQWDGRDDGGREAASGIYIYRLKAGKFVRSKKMLLLH